MSGKRKAEKELNADNARSFLNDNEEEASEEEEVLTEEQKREIASRKIVKARRRRKKADDANAKPANIFLDFTTLIPTKKDDDGKPADTSSCVDALKKLFEKSAEETKVPEKKEEEKKEEKKEGDEKKPEEEEKLKNTFDWGF